MARPVRIEFDGAYYYVTSKSADGSAVFKDVKDRATFVQTLQEVVQRMHWRCLAYNLSTDGFQMVLQTPKANLSKGMRQLNGVYTQRYNARHGHDGNIFHGRFKAILLEQEPYVKEMARYVVTTPLREKKARKLDKWKWSSYPATAGLVETPDWLAVDELLAEFGKQKKRAQQAYAKFVAAADKESDPLADVQGQILLGSDRFVKRWKKQLADGSVLKKAVQRKQKKSKPLSSFAKRYKDEKKAMAEAYASGQYTLTEIANHFNVHYSTVSRAAKRAGV